MTNIQSEAPAVLSDERLREYAESFNNPNVREMAAELLSRRAAEQQEPVYPSREERARRSMGTPVWPLKPKFDWDTPAASPPPVPAGEPPLADWSKLPRDLYVIEAKRHDIGFDVTMCSVPMVTKPEVRYVRADMLPPAVAREAAIKECLRAVADEQMEGAEENGDHPYARAIENVTLAISALLNGDFEQRINSALEPVPAGVSEERVRAARIAFERGESLGMDARIRAALTAALAEVSNG